jgi:hypothetical protein
MKPHFAIAIVVVALQGCATVPDLIDLPVQAPMPIPRIDFRDSRLMDQIAGRRASAEQTETAYYADDQFERSHVALLRVRLEVALGERLAKRTVVLRRFDVYAGTYRRQIPSHASQYGLLGLLVAHSVESARADRRAWSSIKLDVDGKPVEAVISKEVSLGSFNQEMSRLVVESIDAITEKVREHLDMPLAEATKAGEQGPK